MDKRFIFSGIQLPEKYTLYDPAESSGTLSEANAKCTTGSWRGGRGDTWVDNGKWYFEVLVSHSSSGDNNGIGIATMQFPIRNFAVWGPGMWGTRASEYNNAHGRHKYSGRLDLSPGHIVRCAFDFFRGYVWFGDRHHWMEGGDPEHGRKPQITDLVGTKPVAIMTVGYYSIHEILTPKDYRFQPPYGFLPLAHY